MKNKSYYEAIATLIGCIIGAGIFTIPYVVAKAGFLTGLLAIVLLGIASLVINLYLGEITLRTKKIHQLTGYASIYLGNIGRKVMAFAMLVSVYGGLIAYILGEGQALYEIFGIFNPQFFSLIFFSIMALLVYFGLRAIEESELDLVPFIIIIIAIIAVLSIKSINYGNLVEFSLGKIFLPYGVILFAFSGVVAIPEMREELIKHEKAFKRAIKIGSIIPIIIYIIFAFLVIGVTGADTTQVATIGLGKYIGYHMVWIGNLFVVFAMATSFLTLGLALKEMYMYDYNMNELYAWGLTVFIPFIIAFSGLTNFINAIGVTGAIGFGLIGTLSVLMFWKAKKLGKRKPEYSINKKILIGTVLMIVFVLGILYQILSVLGVIG